MFIDDFALEVKRCTTQMKLQQTKDTAKKRKPMKQNEKKRRKRTNHESRRTEDVSCVLSQLCLGLDDFFLCGIPMLVAVPLKGRNILQI
jgi:hypothetical protein